jgi:hypothetical protein
MVSWVVPGVRVKLRRSTSHGSRIKRALSSLPYGWPSKWAELPTARACYERHAPSRAMFPFGYLAARLTTGRLFFFAWPKNKAAPASANRSCFARFHRRIRNRPEDVSPDPTIVRLRSVAILGKHPNSPVGSETVSLASMAKVGWIRGAPVAEAHAAEILSG